MKLDFVETSLMKLDFVETSLMKLDFVETSLIKDCDLCSFISCYNSKPNHTLIKLCCITCIEYQWQEVSVGW
jgi:hypothetical protein